MGAELPTISKTLTHPRRRQPAACRLLRNSQREDQNSPEFDWVISVNARCRALAVSEIVGLGRCGLFSFLLGISIGTKRDEVHFRILTPKIPVWSQYAKLNHPKYTKNHVLLILRFPTPFWPVQKLTKIGPNDILAIDVI